MLVKCILEALLKINDGFCFMMDYPPELFVLVKCFAVEVVDKSQFFCVIGNKISVFLHS